MRMIILILISLTFLNGLSLQRNNSKEVVYDSTNHLLWTDNIDNVKLRMSHKQAEPYCEELVYAGFSDWRLPDIEELKLIVNKKNTRNYIHRAFRYNRASGYWAENAHVRTFWFYADYMNFISGTAYYDNRNVSKYVRCVRDTQ